MSGFVAINKVAAFARIYWVKSLKHAGIRIYYFKNRFGSYFMMDKVGSVQYIHARKDPEFIALSYSL